MGQAILNADSLQACGCPTAPCLTDRCAHASCWTAMGKAADYDGYAQHCHCPIVPCSTDRYVGASSWTCAASTSSMNKDSVHACRRPIGPGLLDRYVAPSCWAHAPYTCSALALRLRHADARSTPQPHLQQRLAPTALPGMLHPETKMLTRAPEKLPLYSCGLSCTWTFSYCRAQRCYRRRLQRNQAQAVASLAHQKCNLHKKTDSCDHQDDAQPQCHQKLRNVNAIASCKPPIF
mmetsp:Transcript_16915/g.46218  ORF Transcript_16915/g.46218 Transcript_16915/m.46218 type:complete len:235 (-) Transcript_16915:623-1327(-)